MTAAPRAAVHVRRLGGVGLWAALVTPSLYAVDKFLGGSTAPYLVLVVLAVWLLPRLRFPERTRSTAALAVATWLGLVAVFSVVFPEVNSQLPGVGSDDDDAHDIGVRALLSLSSPYLHRTYLDNVLHQFPGSYLLAAPFTLLGTSALQNLFWLPAFFACVSKEAESRSFALRLSWLVLLGSPTVLHQVATGTGHAANAIYVLLGLWWLSRTREHTWLAAAAWGVTLASRANFLLLVPLALGWLWQTRGPRTALGAATIACGTAAVITVPFYLAAPSEFGPLEAADRLQRFDGLVPYGGAWVGAVMLVVSLALARAPMSRVTLFRNCAVVQAVPVIAELPRALVQGKALDLGYLGYATFAAWFAYMAWAAAHRAASAAGRLTP